MNDDANKTIRDLVDSIVQKCNEYGVGPQDVLICQARCQQLLNKKAMTAKEACVMMSGLSLLLVTLGRQRGMFEMDDPVGIDGEAVKKMQSKMQSIVDFLADGAIDKLLDGGSAR